MTIGKIGVVGAGTMGNGIAQAFAVAGQDVVMMDVGEAQVQRGLATIGASLDRLIKKDRMTAAQKDAAMARIAALRNRLGAAAAEESAAAAAQAKP